MKEAVYKRCRSDKPVAYSAPRHPEYDSAENASRLCFAPRSARVHIRHFPYPIASDLQFADNAADHRHALRVCRSPARIYICHAPELARACQRCNRMRWYNRFHVEVLARKNAAPALAILLAPGV